MDHASSVLKERDEVRRWQHLLITILRFVFLNIPEVDSEEQTRIKRLEMMVDDQNILINDLPYSPCTGPKYKGT